MFGQGYTPKESLVLENGTYDFMIQRAEEKFNSQGSYLEINLTAKEKANYTPNKIFINDIPKLGQIKNNGKQVEQADIDRWNKSMTTFFDCFGINRGDFNLTGWRGHIGTCKVAPQFDPSEEDKKSKHYKEIYPQKPQNTNAQSNVLSSIPDSVKAMQNAFNGTVTKEPDFPEDISF